MAIEDQDILIADLVKTRTSETLDAADRALLRYAIRLTRTPTHIDEKDIALLRGVGFNDLGIHDICAITAYFAFVNRMADGLGVQLEQRFTP